MNRAFKALKPKTKMSKVRVGVFVSTFAVVGGAILLFSFAAPNPNLPGDLNNDNVVNGADLSFLAANYGTTNSAADINGDGQVNVTDLSILLSHYGASYSGGGNSIYWGAYIDGNPTYVTYYGNPAPNGQNWGDAPWGNTGNTWDRFEQNTGKKVSIDHYGQPNMWNQTTFYSSDANIITNRGAIPMIDYDSGSTPLTAITNGTYDSQITTWANQVKAWGKPFFLRWDWEMNGTWYNYGSQAKANPAAFVQSWQHIHNVVTNAGATNVTWVWCPNTDFSGSTSLSSLYPGSSYVDWTCMDGYNKGGSSASFSNLYQQSYNDILTVAPTKPIMIGEVSSLEYGTNVKANWITDMLSAQLPNNFPKIKAVVWFNWLNPSPFPIESSASSQAAFKAGITSSYYKAGSSALGNLPPLTKVPVP